MKRYLFQVSTVFFVFSLYSAVREPVVSRKNPVPSLNASLQELFCRYCYMHATRIHAIVVCPMKEEWEGVLQYGPMIHILSEHEAIIGVAGRRVLVVQCGIGLSSSSGVVGQLLVRYPCIPICLVGVAGSVHENVKKGEVYVPRKWILVNNIFSSTDNPAAPYNKKYTFLKLNDAFYQVLVGSNQPNHSNDIIDVGYGNGLALSSADFILDVNERNLFKSVGTTVGEDVLLIDMESAGAASVCKQYKLPVKFAAIRVISDDKDHPFDIDEVTSLVGRAYDEFLTWLSHVTSTSIDLSLQAWTKNSK